MTPSGIDPATFPFVAQYLNHCVTASPQTQHVFVLCSRYRVKLELKPVGGGFVTFLYSVPY
jgi:hypothetical protein